MISNDNVFLEVCACPHWKPQRRCQHLNHNRIQLSLDNGVVSTLSQQNTTLSRHRRTRFLAFGAELGVNFQYTQSLNLVPKDWRRQGLVDAQVASMCLLLAVLWWMESIGGTGSGVLKSKASRGKLHLKLSTEALGSDLWRENAR